MKIKKVIRQSEEFRIGFLRGFHGKTAPGQVRCLIREREHQPPGGLRDLDRGGPVRRSWRKGDEAAGAVTGICDRGRRVVPAGHAGMRAAAAKANGLFFRPFVLQIIYSWHLFSVRNRAASKPACRNASRPSIPSRRRVPADVPRSRRPPDPRRNADRRHSYPSPCICAPCRC